MSTINSSRDNRSAEKEAFLETCWKQPNSCKNMRAIECAHRYLNNGGRKTATVEMVNNLANTMHRFAQMEKDAG